jgi:hypothetical protein
MQGGFMLVLAGLLGAVVFVVVVIVLVVILIKAGDF